MNTYRLGVDIDGVLADFTTSYNNLLKKVSGKSDAGLKDGEEPTCWLWAMAYGFTKEEDAKAWEAIKSDPLFWYRLRPYLETPSAIAILQQMYAVGHEVYFITNRPGIHPHLQTVQWLIERGMFPPQVCCQSGKSPDKGPLVKGLQLTHFIDDKPENCFEAKAASPSTEVFMLKKPYQSEEHLKHAAIMEINVITTIRAFFDMLLNEEKVNAIVV